MLTTPVQPVLGTRTRGTRVSSSPSKIPYGEFSPVRLQGRYVRRGLPNRHAHIVASLGLLPSFVLSAFIVVILGLSRGTSRA